ncbi:MAG TPA: PD-(D/E)XK nuclease family protein [Stellaceae bacterium]|nr:PD-(D/E)XK nuclease family protein [Stellaceae bacterium]
MVLDRRRESELVPEYSLTGDLLSFLRCGLQYRYHNGSSLPPSRPVQLWFGEFVHGAMEAAFRIWRDAVPRATFPWPMNITPHRGNPPTGRLGHDVGTIGDTIEGTLRVLGKNPRSNVVRDSAYRRVERAINELGPDLFPLIAAAEELVIGTREIPGATGTALRARLYELHGIIDVVTDVELTGAPDSNIFKRAVQAAYPGLTGRFEVIVDYKGSRRPATTHDYWQQGDWQVQTYAWLRGRQSGTLPVAAGILIYINELAPTSDDIEELRREVTRRQTDIAPANGSADYYQLNTWRPGNAIPAFSLEFRLARAIRVIPVNAQTQIAAAAEFDRVVQSIESCVDTEAAHGQIIAHWPPRGDEETCAACDFRHFCPDPAPRHRAHVITAPSAP